MLRVALNKKNVNSYFEKIPISAIDFINYNEGDSNFENKLIAKCTSESVDKLTEGQYITIAKTINSGYTFSEEVIINHVDAQGKFFFVEIEKYKNLEATMIRCFKDKDEKTTKTTFTIYIDFTEPHHFEEKTKPDSSETNLLYFFDTYAHNENGKKVHKLLFDWYSETTLKVDVDSEKFTESDIYGFLKAVIDELKLKDFCNLEDDEHTSIMTNLHRFQVKRETPLCAKSEGIEPYILIEVNQVAVPIPISLSYNTNLLQDEVINEVFVENEERKALNRIIDVEKDVYYPSIYKQDENGKYVFVKDVYEINFNLHFREHRGKDWLVDRESFWNGVTKTTTPPTPPSTNTITKYEVDTKITTSSTSDLLSFLNFTNDDVKYQKNKLKKSFLRISFYDSDNPLNNNLLAYSTIYFNTGELFSKYIRHFNTNGYTTIVPSTESGIYNKIKNVNGIRVDREYSGSVQSSLVEGISSNKTLVQKAKSETLTASPLSVTNLAIPSVGLSLDWETITKMFFNPLLQQEKFRLSSQFVVKGKNMTSSSSEGFYLYLWREDETHIPQDIYMKVEFNHAGFGRVIPFMAPYSVEKKTFKSFNEILTDFTGGNEAKPYTLADYNKFSYIKLKYCYNKDLQKHYYFIDPERYGSQDNNENKIVINLYEAKLTDKI